MNRIHNTGKRAFTFAEVMISLLLFSIVSLIGYTMLNRTFVSMERQKQSLDTLHEARSFLMTIERDLREMTELVELDTIYKEDLYSDENALLYKMVLRVPSRIGSGTDEIIYSYKGPENYAEAGKNDKIITREVVGGSRREIITTQLKHLKVWGTDGVIFRNRYANESLSDYRLYLRPHYYHPTNSASKGLRNLGDVKGVEVQLCMHEVYGTDKKPIKQRTFVTRIYSRILNAKYE